MKILKSCLIAVPLLLFAHAPAAVADPILEQPKGDDFYCAERKLGTWFYCDKPKAKPSQKSNSSSNPAPNGAMALSQLTAVKRQLEERKALAIMYPTVSNITNYVSYQREQLDRASKFADTWQRALWQNPDLDYTLQRPVNTLGKRTWKEARKSDQDRTMDALAQRYGIFYFFSSNCAACRTFSPILKTLSIRHQFPVMAVSLDGGGTSAFDKYVIDNGQYEMMGLVGRQVPAVVLFDSVTKKPIPIGYGVMAADEITERIFQLTQIAPGSDY